jgi:hypothetical protein
MRVQFPAFFIAGFITYCSSVYPFFSKEFAMNTARLWAPLLVLAFVSPSFAVVVDFEDLPTASYGVGGVFNSNGIMFNVIAYNGLGSGVFIQKSGSPVNTRVFAGNSAGVNVGLPTNTNLISFDFGDFCTGCSETGITVNGIASSPTVQLTALDGTTLGGAAIDVVQGSANIHRMTLTGPITTFAIGGTELQLDNLRIAVPEPATSLLTACCICALFLRRRR